MGGIYMNLSTEDIMREYEELKKHGFPIGETLDFGEELGRSAEIALHFEFIIEDGKKPRPQRWHPEDFYRFHGQEGVDYLRPLLTSQDEEYAVGAAYLMAELLLKGRYLNQAELTSELIGALVALAESEVPEHRRKSIIALGWVGTENEIPMLKRHLLSDPDSLCRAWSASSFLQMSGRIPEAVLRKRTAGALIACLENETDVFVRGVAVETVQVVWDVKLGLRSSAVDDRNQKAVNRGVRRALEFLTAENCFTGNGS